MSRVGWLFAAFVMLVGMGLHPLAAHGDIDASGQWFVRSPSSPPLSETWTQTGTSLISDDGWSGTIDPVTGDFSLSRSSGACPDDTRSGTVAADGLSFTGTETDQQHGTPTLCIPGTPFPITGVRSLCSDPSPCRTAGKSSLLIQTTATGRKNKLVWKWIKGAATSEAEVYGVAADYELCVFAGTSAAAVGHAELPSNASETVTASGQIRFKGAAGTPGGLRRLTLKPGADGRAKIIAKGMGSTLSINMPPLTPPVTVEVINSATDVCWAASYDAQAMRINQPGMLKAVSSP